MNSYSVIFQPQAPDVKSRLQSLQDQIEVQLKENESLLDSLRKLREETLAGQFSW